MGRTEIKRRGRRPTAQSGAPPHHCAAAPLARAAKVAVFILGGSAELFPSLRICVAFFRAGVV